MRALFASIAIIAAASTLATAADPLSTLNGSEWGFPDAGDAYIQFREKDVAGFSGCNRFFGSYSFVGGELTFGPLVSTRMACSPDKMETERKILQLLEAVKAASATHTVLTLKDGTGALLATLNRRDFD
jgi:heat shock protein HslJ